MPAGRGVRGRRVVVREGVRVGGRVGAAGTQAAAAEPFAGRARPCMHAPVLRRPAPGTDAARAASPPSPLGLTLAPSALPAGTTGLMYAWCCTRSPWQRAGAASSTATLGPRVRSGGKGGRHTQGVVGLGERGWGAAWGAGQRRPWRRGMRCAAPRLRRLHPELTHPAGRAPAPPLPCARACPTESKLRQPVIPEIPAVVRWYINNVINRFEALQVSASLRFGVLVCLCVWWGSTCARGCWMCSRPLPHYGLQRAGNPWARCAPRDVPCTGKPTFPTCASPLCLASTRSSTT